VAPKLGRHETGKRPDPGRRFGDTGVELIVPMHDNVERFAMPPASPAGRTPISVQRFPWDCLPNPGPNVSQTANRAARLEHVTPVISRDTYSGHLTENSDMSATSNQHEPSNRAVGDARRMVVAPLWKAGASIREIAKQTKGEGPGAMSFRKALALLMEAVPAKR
jgi:hypothetical protein